MSNTRFKTPCSRIRSSVAFTSDGLDFAWPDAGCSARASLAGSTRLSPPTVRVQTKLRRDSPFGGLSARMTFLLSRRDLLQDGCCAAIASRYHFTSHRTPAQQLKLGR